MIDLLEIIIDSFTNSSLIESLQDFFDPNKEKSIMTSSTLETVVFNNTLHIEDKKVLNLIIQDILETNPKVSNENAKEWANKIILESKKYKINPFLIASQANLESAWNPTAVGKDNDMGLIQIVDKTAKSISKDLGYNRFNKGILLDPIKNIEFAAYYLDYCYDQTEKYIGDDFTNKDWLAIASYNKGVIPAVKEYISGNLDKTSYVFHVKKRFTENFNQINIIF